MDELATIVYLVNRTRYKVGLLDGKINILADSWDIVSQKLVTEDKLAIFHPTGTLYTHC